MNIKLLTQRQRQVIDALIEHGTEKGAAKALGIARSTLSESLQTSRRRAYAKTTWQLVAGHAVAKAQEEVAA